MSNISKAAIFLNAVLYCFSGAWAQETVQKTHVRELPRYMTDTPQLIPEQIKLPDAPPTARDTRCFRGLTKRSSMLDVVRRCGIPDEHHGSGIYIFLYKMEDGSIVAVGTPDLTQLAYVDHIHTVSESSLLEDTPSVCVDKASFPKFEQFAVGERFRGRVHALVLKARLARRFRTVIREAMAGGVNFAGHYVVASWGCGTGCIQFAVVDAITGEVYAPPFDAAYFHLSLSIAKKWPDFDAEGKWWCEQYADWPTFKANSSLLIVEGCVGDRQCGRTFYAMKATGLEQVYFDPDLSPDGSIVPP
jgi:hypothetical protein